MQGWFLCERELPTLCSPAAWCLYARARVCVCACARVRAGARVCACVRVCVCVCVCWPCMPHAGPLYTRSDSQRDARTLSALVDAPGTGAGTGEGKGPGDSEGCFDSGLVFPGSGRVFDLMAEVSEHVELYSMVKKYRIDSCRLTLGETIGQGEVCQLVARWRCLASRDMQHQLLSTNNTKALLWCRL